MLGDILKKLRLERELTRKSVAEALNIDQSTYGKYELNKREPDAKTLKILADYFGVSLDFLLGHEESTKKQVINKEIELSEKDKKQIQQKAEHLKSAMLNFVGIAFDGKPQDEETLQMVLETLEEGLVLAKKKPKEGIHLKNIVIDFILYGALMINVQNKVNMLVRKFKTKNPFILCKELNIILIYKNFNNPIRGIYQYDSNVKIIYINDNLNEALKRQVCAHELGHSLFHKNVNSLFLDSFTFLLNNKLEIEANMFAAELLISDEDIYSLKGYSKECLASCLGVEEFLIDYKLRLMNLNTHIK